jgi:small-conductance mechanosensitive channel
LGAALLIVAALLALAVHRLIGRVLARIAGHASPFLATLLRQSRAPSAMLMVVIAVGAALPTTTFSDRTTSLIGHALVITTVLALGWAAFNAIDLAASLYLRRFRIDVADNLLARKHVTQVRILQRAAQTMIGIITVAAALMTFDAVRQYGVSLFASAGVAGLVVGLAARPLFSNLIAGIQIAVTQPIRVEDSVVVEGEWGWIETIGSTYVVVRVWDRRRLIVPLTYFIEKPFQNWTYESTDLLGAVLLHVDYSVPVARVREKLSEIVKDHPLWDGKVVNLQVTDTPGAMVELRALVSARNAPEAWDLRCDVRERLIAFLQTDYPHALPRQRAEIEARGVERHAREPERRRA